MKNQSPLTNQCHDQVHLHHHRLTPGQTTEQTTHPMDGPKAHRIQRRHRCPPILRRPAHSTQWTAKRSTKQTATRTVIAHEIHLALRQPHWAHVQPHPRKVATTQNHHRPHGSLISPTNRTPSVTRRRTRRRKWTPPNHCQPIYRPHPCPRSPSLRPLLNLSKNSLKPLFRKPKERPKRNSKRNSPTLPSNTNKRHKQSGPNYYTVPSRSVQTSSHNLNKQYYYSNNKQWNSKGSGTNATVNVLKRKRSGKRNSYNNRKPHEWQRKQRLVPPKPKLQTNKPKRRPYCKLSYYTFKNPSWKRPALRDWTHPAQQPRKQPTRPPPSHTHQTQLRLYNGTRHHLCSLPSGYNTSWTSAPEH